MDAFSAKYASDQNYKECQLGKFTTRSKPFWKQNRMCNLCSWQKAEE